MAQNHRNWTDLGSGLYSFRDSCIVYALDVGTCILIFNAGTGRWLDYVDELPKRIEAVYLTHFFRDHSAGAILAANQGFDIRASFWEREQLGDPHGLFARRETYIIYDNTWDLFAPIEPIPVAQWLHDYERTEIGDAVVDILPAPGASIGGIAVGVEYDGRRLLFAGEAIHTPGTMLRIAPLQYNYNDLTGAPALIYSLSRINEWSPDLILSSTSPEPILNTSHAVELLIDHLEGALDGRPETQGSIESATHDEIDQITPHLYKSRYSEASSYFLVSKSGKVMAIDYGYRRGISFGASYPYPRNRRPLLHGLDALRRQFGTEQIDAVLVTHFHDDHVNGIPQLQRMFGTTCFASDVFADILANPQAFAFPCTWPEPIDVVSVDSTFTWEEYEFRLHPMSGHTRFSTLVEFSVDDVRVLATGDQYFFVDFERPGKSPSMHNHVYRNGALLESFDRSTEVIKSIRPDVILPGHGEAYRVPDELYDRIDAYTEEYRAIHENLMPLGKDDVHFEVDSRAAWIVPYRTHLREAAPIKTTVHVRNPYPAQTTLQIRAVVPDGWTGGETSLTLSSREEGAGEIVITPPAGAVCRRQPIAVELVGPDRTFGHVAEGLITIGHPAF